jgi:UTP--glucose-1-phosphate uridylyltransferase
VRPGGGEKRPLRVMVGDDLMFGMEPGIKQLLTVAMTEHLR